MLSRAWCALEMTSAFFSKWGGSHRGLWAEEGCTPTQVLTVASGRCGENRVEGTVRVGAREAERRQRQWSRGTVMEEWDSSLRSPGKQDHRSDRRTPPSPITPHFPAEDMKAHS